MKTRDKKTVIPQRPRELTERDLNALTRGVGEQVRAQTLIQREQLKRSLKNELVATRAAFLVNERKRSKT